MTKMGKELKLHEQREMPLTSQLTFFSSRSREDYVRCTLWRITHNLRWQYMRCRCMPINFKPYSTVNNYGQFLLDLQY